MNVFVEKFARKALFGTHSYQSLISWNFLPNKTFQEIVKILIPNISNEDLLSLARIDEILQEAYFRPYDGKFRYEIWKPNDENISFESPVLQAWLHESLKEQKLKDLPFKPNTAIIMGSTLPNFCKRFAYLLSQMATSKIYIPTIAILSGNRMLQESEKKEFKERGFTADSEIVTEYDFMEAIVSRRENVERMLEATGIDPLEEKVVAKKQSIASVLADANVGIGDCLCAYDQFEKFVTINSVHERNKPTTFDTVKDYIKFVKELRSQTIVIVSSQPFCDYQILTTVNAILKAFSAVPQSSEHSSLSELIAHKNEYFRKSMSCLPKEIGCIGPGVSNVPANLFGNHIAKLVYTIIDILEQTDVKIRLK